MGGVMNMLAGINAIKKTPEFAETKTPATGFSQIKLKKNFKDNLGKINDMISQNASVVDIAKETGVSVSTISRYRSKVSPESSLKVANRLNKMVKFIRENDEFTFGVKDLAEVFKVSPSTVSKDINRDKRFVFGHGAGIKKKIGLAK